MPSTKSSTVNLGLPASPETTDKVLFSELIRVYNALNILAQFLDDYTSDGNIAVDLQSLNTQIEDVITSIVDLKHTGEFDTLKSAGAFSCNGKPLQTTIALPTNAVDPATSYALINAIKSALIAYGFAS